MGQNEEKKITAKTADEVFNTSEALIQTIKLYRDMVIGVSASTPELKKAVQNLIKEFCTTFFVIEL